MDVRELGRHVSRRRKELGISQDRLAQEANLSRNYISLIERGEAKNISMNVISQLSAALKTSPRELLGQSTEESAVIPPSLRRLGIEDHLSYETIEWLARMPRRGPEPKSVDEWRSLYNVLRELLEG